MQTSVEEKKISTQDTMEWLQNSLGMSISDLMPKNLINASKVVYSSNHTHKK